MSQKDLETELTIEEIDLDGILRQESGRNFILRVLEKTGYFESTFNEDERKSCLAQGSREIGIWLADECSRVNHARFMDILGEHYK